MTMPGGGPFGVGPGQITDDSELAICLMHAFVDRNSTCYGDEEYILPTSQIARYYGQWFDS